MSEFLMIGSVFVITGNWISLLKSNALHFPAAFNTSQTPMNPGLFINNEIKSNKKDQHYDYGNGEKSHISITEILKNIQMMEILN